MLARIGLSSHVQSMLQAGTSCTKCGSALVSGSRFCSACGADANAEPTNIDDRYEIVEKLGEGAFGPTYLVRDKQLQHQAILKLRKHADPGLAPRLAREVSAFSRIDHPNIAAVTDTGMTVDGTPYLVMQYVAGTGLDVLLRRGALRLQDALDAATGIGKGLQALHQRGLLHRDLKPSNIVIPGEGAPQFERATLIDFGVFGELVQRRGDAQTTMAGEVFGTPTYMSPEQLKGEEQSVAADVYGLGLVLYEMLAPEHPLYRSSDIGSLITRATNDVVVPSNVALLSEVKDLIEGMLRVLPAQRLTLDQVLAKLVTVDKPSTTPVARVRDREPAAGAAPPRQNVLRLAVSAGVLAIVAIITGRSAAGTTLPRGVMAAVSGLAIAGAGYAIARLTRSLAAARRPEIEGEAAKVMLGTQSREALTATLAIQVDHLVERCRQMGEAYWGHTVALMLKEYEDARDAKDRREALMNVATLLERVTAKLSPWYVRHDKALAATLTSVGIAGGLWKIVFDVLNLSKP